MSGTKRNLPDGAFKAAINSVNPSASNPFVTASEVPVGANLSNSHLTSTSAIRKFTLSGSTSSESLQIHSSTSVSPIFSVRGDGTSKFSGSVGIGVDPVWYRRLYIEAGEYDEGAYVQSGSGTAGIFNSTSGRGIDATGESVGGVFLSNGTGVDSSGGSIGVYASGGSIGVYARGGTYGVFGNATGGSGIGGYFTQGTGAYALKSNGKVNFSSLPTSSTGLSAGDIWNNAGVLTIV